MTGVAGSMSSSASGAAGMVIADEASKRATQAIYDTNAANAAENLEARRWADTMRSTQYQRTVEDMRKAGLNPAVMLNSGASASSGPGAPTPIAMKSAGDAIIASGLEKARIMKDLAEQSSRTNKNMSESYVAQKVGQANVNTAETQQNLNDAMTEQHKAITEGIKSDNVLKKTTAEAVEGSKFWGLVHGAMKAVLGK